MRYMFVADIHGSIDGFNKVVEIFEKESADKLIILGDTSSFTDEQANKYISKKINDMKNKIELIKGNCDTYSFEEMLESEMYNTDYFYIGNKTIVASHGHLYNANEIDDVRKDIYVQGHTHIPILSEKNGKIYANPGSITRPRGLDLRCYIVIDEEKIELKTLDGKLVKEIIFTT